MSTSESTTPNTDTSHSLIERTTVAIVGGGLSGVHAALQLDRAGFKDYLLFEAKDELGGRLFSPELSWKLREEDDRKFSDRFDLGAAWLWPSAQLQLAEVLKELGVKVFPQHNEGHSLVERSSTLPARRMLDNDMDGYMRVEGGMKAFLDACSSKLDHRKLRVGEQIRKIQLEGEEVNLFSRDQRGNIRSYSADHVLLALPPRLVAESVEFKPDLPVELKEEWRGISTWMAPHAKYIAVYDEAFWRNEGLSGDAFSSNGPLGEIHDASSARGSAALFGFFSMNAKSRAGLDQEDLKQECRNQLGRLFGKGALTPKIDMIKDWSKDQFVATQLDEVAGRHSTSSPCLTPQIAPWKNRIIGIGTEFSPKYPGFVAGAVDAAHRGVDHLLKLKRSNLKGPSKEIGLSK